MILAHFETPILKVLNLIVLHFSSIEGNQRLRNIIALNLPLYIELKTRKNRQELFASILDEILLDGVRFLERKGSGWFKLTRAQAHKKVGHAFRDAALRQSIRISKFESLGDSSEKQETVCKRPGKRQKWEFSNCKVQWVNLELSDDVVPQKQLSASRPPSPDWFRQLEHFLCDNVSADLNPDPIEASRADLPEHCNPTEFLLL